MILILGAKGMLGGQLRKTFPDCLGWDREDCDVTKIEDLKLKIKDLNEKPKAIINCVAYNDVDGAESHRDIAFTLNTEVPKNLSILCHELGIPLIHFSTNYVFDGEKGEYEESDQPQPLSTYAESKYGGEQEVIQNAKKYYVIRSAVLFGQKGESELSKKSFIEIMLDLRDKSDTIKAVADEENSITYVKDLAAAVKYILDKSLPFGIYHIANFGSASWYDFAKEIFSIKKLKVNVVPVSSGDFPRPAKRPKKSVLINFKLPPLRPWQEALKEYLSFENL